MNPQSMQMDTARAQAQRNVTETQTRVAGTWPSAQSPSVEIPPGQSGVRFPAELTQIGAFSPRRKLIYIPSRAGSVSKPGIRRVLHMEDADKLLPKSLISLIHKAPLPTHAHTHPQPHRCMNLAGDGFEFNQRQVVRWGLGAEVEDFPKMLP